MPKGDIRSRNLKARKHKWRLQSFLVLFLLAIVLSGLQITASDYPFGVFNLFLSFFFWLLCCLAFKLRLLITPLASSSFSCPFSFGYCVVWPSNDGLWLPLWHLQAFLVLFLLVIVLSCLQITASDSPSGIFKLFLSFFFWLLCCLTFKLRLLARQHNNKLKKDKKSLKMPKR
jgi:hypothetical protein